MKLHKVSGRLMLRSAVAVIVMLQALSWVLLLFGGRLRDYFLHYHYVAAIARVLVYILPILLFGCLLFFVRDIYIHGVSNKHPRLTIAARVLGALGASAAFSLFLLYPLTPVGLFMSLMAIMGIKLALARPKVAGILMLLAGIMPLPSVVLLFLWVFFGVSFHGLLQPEDPLFEVIMLAWFSFITFLASLLLIPGGIAALLSPRHQERLSQV